MGTQLPPKGAQPALQFSAHVRYGQTAGWIKMPLGTEVGLAPRDIVLDGDPAPPKKENSSPRFSAHVYCGETAGWIKMPLGTEVGLGPGDIVHNESHYYRSHITILTNFVLCHFGLLLSPDFHPIIVLHGSHALHHSTY